MKRARVYGRKQLPGPPAPAANIQSSGKVTIYARPNATTTSLEEVLFPSDQATVVVQAIDANTMMVGELVVAYRQEDCSFSVFKAEY